MDTSKELVKKFETIKINDYDNPPFKMLSCSGSRFPKDLFFGFELETNFPQKGTCSHRSATAIKLTPEYNHLKNIFYAKYDGSVESNSSWNDGSYGIEINSHPFTWNWLIKNKKYFVDLGNFLDLNKAVCNRTCGFHVHLSKKFFNKEHLKRFLYMIYLSPDFIKNISRREKRDLDEFATTSLDTVLAGEDLTLKNIEEVLIKGEGGDEKYIAANTFHDNTVEIRIFQSTKNTKLFVSYLEFCLSLALYTKNPDNKLDIRDYKRYVKKHPKKYPEINKTNLLNKCNISYKSANSYSKISSVGIENNA